MARCRGFLRCARVERLSRQCSKLTQNLSRESQFLASEKECLRHLLLFECAVVSLVELEISLEETCLIMGEVAQRARLSHQATALEGSVLC